jgi:TolA-binding protein
MCSSLISEEVPMQRFSKATGMFAAVVLLFAFLAMPAPAAARDSQTAMLSAADIQRLQDAVYDAGREVARLRSQNPDKADQLQAQLDDLRDEVIYLKVKQRKEGSASRADYGRLRDQIDDIRIEARNAMPAAASDEGRPFDEPRTTPGAVQAGDTRTGQSTEPPRQRTTTTRANEVPAGTEMDVRLEKALTSDTAQVEDRFTATTLADLYNGNKVLVPAGSSVRGIVTSATKAGRVERTGKLTLAFDQVTVNGRSYPMHATVTEALQSGGYRQDAGKIGAGAGVGAILGGILGGFKGALAGILIGGGGVVAATEGKDVELPIGTVLRIRLDSALTVR